MTNTGIPVGQQTRDEKEPQRHQAATCIIRNKAESLPRGLEFQRALHAVHISADVRAEKVARLRRCVANKSFAPTVQALSRGIVRHYDGTVPEDLLFAAEQLP